MKPIRNFERIKETPNLTNGLLIRRVFRIEAGGHNFSECSDSPIHAILLSGARIQIHILWQLNAIRLSDMDSDVECDYRIGVLDPKSPQHFIRLLNYTLKHFCGWKS
jgi:hypothetical protein